ncbi:MAG: GIY-YIG nuclease family protein [Pseudomonadota bacterium]
MEDRSIDMLLAAINQGHPVHDAPLEYGEAEELAGVYFITCRNYVKVGHSQCISSRMKTLQGHIPFQLCLLGALEGTTADENRIHRALSKKHHHNEWFHLSDQLEQILIFETVPCEIETITIQARKSTWRRWDYRKSPRGETIDDIKFRREMKKREQVGN